MNQPNKNPAGQFSRHQLIAQRLKNGFFTSLSLAIYDIIAVMGGNFLALWLRFDAEFARIPARYMDAYRHFVPWWAFISVGIFFLFRMYRSVWRYASFNELQRTFLGSLTSSVLHIVGITLLCERMPISYYVIGALLQLILLIVARFAYRGYTTIKSSFDKSGEIGAARVMLIGAGSAGQMILRDMRNASEITDKVVCIIDDNPNKWGRSLDGVPIVGGRDDILWATKKYSVDKIYLTIPSATAQQKRDILAICNETGCQLRQLPGMYQFVLDQVSVSTMKKVSVEDLLGREPIRANMEEVFAFISGKVVMVTGGGGSIGSELCRQIAAHAPKQLIIFDVYENNAYAIQMELKKKYPELDLVTLIGSVRDSRRIFQVFETYHPQIVYHAAAHKHVPLMEDSPCEAIKNNAIGTYKTAYAAMVYGCERFVLISTDKAVNPTNVMGASKRLCEMIVQAFDSMIKKGRTNEIPQLFTHSLLTAMPDYSDALKAAKTEFVAVRFGNVLGSNGSVVPLFQRQIEAGGPVTVTHPDIIRYFMTIPEAVSLVMQAGTYAKGGEIFVLDMGSPVKIDTLARNLIKLSGYKPDIDIPIVYTGLRPGEKLYEEKLMAEEGLKKTDNDLIHIGNPIPFDVERFFGSLSPLMDTAYANKEDEIRGMIAAIVNTYRPEGVTPTAVKDATYKALAHETDDQ